MTAGKISTAMNTEELYFNRSSNDLYETVKYV